MNGFSDEDLPVAIGHVLGLRWFGLQTRLKEFPIPNPDYMDTTRVTFDTSYMTHKSVEVPVLRGARGIWEPGVNHAVCLQQSRGVIGIGGTECQCGPCSRDRELWRQTTGSRPPHEVPVRECLCGFWAYWHLGAQQADSPHIAGLVKGYGKVIKGKEGFRCSTAEIVALVTLVPNATVALWLEQEYQVPVYGTIEALLERHKAPPTQKPLADNFFRNHRQVRQETYGGKRLDESYYGYGARIGFMSPPSLPCTTCGVVGAVRTGQYQCDPCIRTSLVAAQNTALTRMRGITAQAELHARRESWAKAAQSVLGAVADSQLPAMSFRVPGEAVVRQEPDTCGAVSQIQWALEFMKEKYGTSSWWRYPRKLGKPGK